MNILRLTALFVLGIACTHDSIAQSTDSTASKERTHLIAGVTYNSGLNYYGRVDSLKSKGIYAFVGLTLKDGLYVNATFVFVRNSLLSEYGATLLEGGYNFKDKKGNWIGNLSVTKYFYQANIELIQSAVKESASATLTHVNKIVNITIGASARWSDKVDLNAQAGLDHIIRIPNVLSKQGVLVFDPAAIVYAGTQNFTQTYERDQNFSSVPVAEQQATANSRAFNVLAYELSMPIVYGYKKINLFLTPAYVLPQHLLTVPDQPSLSEQGANLFYVTASIKVTL